jgi:hypothetical protein
VLGEVDLAAELEEVGPHPAAGTGPTSTIPINTYAWCRKPWLGLTLKNLSSTREHWSAADR